jgi:glycosyltransferase involved in cell wall biosynthesis
MMNVAWLTTGFSKNENDTGGAAAIHNLARELSLKSNIDLTIFSLYYPLNQPEYKFHNAGVFSFAGNKEHKKINKPGIWKACIKKFGEVHKVKPFDLVHSMWAGESGNVAAKLANKHKIPLIVNICGGELAEIKEINYGSRLKYWQKRFVDKSLNAADKIVSGSDFITDKIMKYYGKDVKDKTVKIPFGVDEKVFYPDKSIEYNNKFNLINIANAVPVKAHESLFKAIKIVSEKYPEVKLRIYGRDDKHTLEKLADGMGAGKIIEINDFIEHDKIAGALNHAGIYVLSSLYESQNMSIIEAGFCGLPVVSTDVGAAREVTEHIVKPGYFENFALKIIQVIDNYDLELKISKEKIPGLLEKYSLNTITDKFEKLYINITS